MYKFLLKAFVFCLPFLILFSLPLSLLFITGEELPLSYVVSRQQALQGDTLYLSGITSAYDKTYKLLTTEERDPEIIAFGTSRTLTFEPQFFKDPAHFYNAGYNGGQFLRSSDLVEFIHGLPAESHVHLIVFDASSYLTESAAQSPYQPSTSDIVRAFVTEYWRTEYNDFMSGKFSIPHILSTLTTNHNMGTMAYLYGYGYRPDGSLDRNEHKTSDELITQMDHDTKIELANIAAAPNRGELPDYSRTIPETDVANIKEFLSECKKRNITVVGYLSPYTPEIHQALKGLQNGYGDSYRSAPAVLSSLFTDQGYDFFDLRDSTVVGIHTDEWYDSHHPTEKGTVRLLGYLLDHSKSLDPYVDHDTIDTLIASSTLR